MKGIPIKSTINLIIFAIVIALMCKDSNNADLYVISATILLSSYMISSIIETKDDK